MTYDEYVPEPEFLSFVYFIFNSCGHSVLWIQEVDSSPESPSIINKFTHDTLRSRLECKVQIAALYVRN